ncbi:DEAD/DEAH box helicase [Nannocystaceae bacterium ST9]
MPLDSLMTTPESLPTDDDTFDAIPAPLRAAMQRRGFTQLTAVQRAALAPGHEGRNLRISSQTGSGKTVALGLVLADALLADKASRRGPVVLVITPTRELAIQVRGELTWLFADVGHVDIEVVTGGIDIRGDHRRLFRRPRVLVATPGRLLDHMRSGSVDCSDVAHVVLDEADQMLDMGFRDDLDAIVGELPEGRRSHLVSATFPRAVRELADRFQRDAVVLEGNMVGAAHADIETTVYRVDDLYPSLVNLLLLAQGRRCLVFVRRRVDASELAEKLAGDGFSALPFSGDLAQAQRIRTLDAFRHGIVNTLISTDVAARGIDVPDIATVIHAELPNDVESFVHRSGRTGRAGRKGQSLILMPRRAERRIRELLRAAKIEASWSEVPGPEQVEKALRKRMRRDLHARLDQAKIDQTWEAGELEYAAKLLAEHDPQTVVSVLLRMAEPMLAREPMVIEQPRPRRDPRDRDPRDRDRREPRGDRDREPRGERSFDRGAGAGGGGGDRERSNEDFVRFEINWGHRNGATPARLLAHLCRRGGVSARAIGALRIDRSHSNFEIAASAAESFASKAAIPDQRDPGLKINRAQ